MVRIGILNSDSIRYEDVDISIYAKAFLTPWVIDGLSISEVDGQIVVAKGNGLIACTRSNGDEVVVPIVVKNPETIEKLNGKLVCVSIPQANIDNPTINTDRNQIAKIVLSDTVGANSIKIGRIDSTGALLQEQDKSWLSDGAMLRDILLRGAVIFSQIPSSLQEPTEDSHLTTKQYVDDTIANAWAVSNLTETIYPLWEPVAKNDCLFVEDAGRIEDITTFQAIGKETTNQKVAYRIMGNGVSSNSISLPLCAVGNSPIPLTVRIEGGDNQPNGQLVHAQAQATINRNQITGTTSNYTMHTVSFPASFTIPSTAWVVLSQGTNTVNSTNYYGIGVSNTHSSTRYLATHNWSWQVLKHRDITNRENNVAGGTFNDGQKNGWRGVGLISKNRVNIKRIDKINGSQANKVRIVKNGAIV